MGYQSDFVRAFGGNFVADGVPHRKVIDLTNAEIKALRASPKTLVPAPGAGYFLQLDSLWLILNAGTNVLSESADNLVVEYASGVDATAAIETTGFIDQAVDQVAYYRGINIATATAADIANQGLRLFNTGDGEIAGNAALDATMRVVVNYRIFKTGL